MSKRQENILKNDSCFHGYLLVCVAGSFWNEIGINDTEENYAYSACVVMAKQREAELK